MLSNNSTEVGGKVVNVNLCVCCVLDLCLHFLNCVLEHDSVVQTLYKRKQKGFLFLHVQNLLLDTNQGP